MTRPTDLVRGFYTKLKEGDAAGALGLIGEASEGSEEGALGDRLLFARDVGRA